MDDQKLIEQLQDALDRHEHDTQELKRENEELRQSVNDLLQKEKKSEELRERLGELLSAGSNDADLKQRLRTLLGDFEKCTESILEMRDQNLSEYISHVGLEHPQ